MVKKNLDHVFIWKQFRMHSGINKRIIKVIAITIDYCCPAQTCGKGGGEVGAGKVCSLKHH